MKKSIGARTLIYPNPVLIVGTFDDQGKPNLMTAAWGGICCSEPPCVAVSLRKATLTYHNIVFKKAFTVGILTQEQVKQADYFGIASGKDVNKFEAVNYTPVKSDLVDAPYAKEFPFFLECELLHTLEIGLHTQFIGKIVDIKVDEQILGEKGLPDIEKLKPFLYSAGNSNYYGIGENLGKAFSIGKIL